MEGHGDVLGQVRSEQEEALADFACRGDHRSQEIEGEQSIVRKEGGGPWEQLCIGHSPGRPYTMTAGSRRRLLFIFPFIAWTATRAKCNEDRELRGSGLRQQPGPGADGGKGRIMSTYVKLIMAKASQAEQRVCYPYAQRRLRMRCGCGYDVWMRVGENSLRVPHGER